MKDKSLDLLAQSDTYAVIEYLAQQPDRLTAAKTYVELVRHCYWQQKDLPLTVMLARAGIQHGLTTAHTTASADSAYELRSLAKTLAYDLASFTWPGWDEPGIVTDASQVAVGLDAAKLNLRLARELEKGGLPLARAYWMLGAQCVAHQQYVQAKAHFADSAHHAQATGESAEALLAQAFAALTDVLAAPDDPAPRQTLADLKHQLAAQPDGEAFVSQADTALRVFSSPRKG